MGIERCRWISKGMANMSSLCNSTAKNRSRVCGEPIDLLLAWSIRHVLPATTKELWFFRVPIDLGNETSGSKCSRERFDRLVILRGLK
jgi:hypothetical protein